jgi:glutathione-specific gamma-glutamylcyclotransferase
MALTPELVALCHRVVEDPGPLPHITPLSDGDYRPAALDVLSRKPPGYFWLFAYGSLIWKPEVPHERLLRATASGWHRAFSLRIERFRASREQPGYMMCLDPGGHCEGVVLQMADQDQEALMEKLLRRELSRKAALEAVRWIAVETSEGPVSALAFYAGPTTLDSYVEGRPNAEVAAGLARACGHWGSGAEYLYNTVHHLESQGIHDAGLWQLQELVAAEIKVLYGLTSV